MKLDGWKIKFPFKIDGFSGDDMLISRGGVSFLHSFTIEVSWRPFWPGSTGGDVEEPHPKTGHPTDFAGCLFLCFDR